MNKRPAQWQPAGFIVVGQAVARNAAERAGPFFDAGIGELDGQPIAARQEFSPPPSALPATG